MATSAEADRTHRRLESGPWDPARLAAAVVTNEHGHLHVGILHHRGALHLAWEDQLRNDWGFERFLWICPSAQEELLRNAAQMCRKIWKQFEKDRRIPYGLGLEATFDAEGHMRSNTGTRGLTCATLVVAAFRVVGIDLLRETTWPVRTELDRVWLDYLRHRFPRLNLDRLERDIDEGKIRILPEEVIGSCTQPPTDFEEAVRRGAEVLDALHALEDVQITESLDATFLE